MLKLLEELLRDGEPVPDGFIEELRDAVGMGDLEVLTAGMYGEIVGVAMLAFRLSVSAGGRFASIEELYVHPEFRRRGVGRALLEAVAGRCSRRGVSYVEVQVVDEAARTFYGALGYGLEDEVRVLSRSHPVGGLSK